MLFFLFNTCKISSGGIGCSFHKNLEHQNFVILAKTWSKAKQLTANLFKLNFKIVFCTSLQSRLSSIISMLSVLIRKKESMLWLLHFSTLLKFSSLSHTHTHILSLSLYLKYAYTNPHSLSLSSCCFIQKSWLLWQIR